MTNEIRLGVMTDGTPVSEKVLASGMFRVNTRLFRALSKQITLIATTNYGNTYRYRDIAEDLQDRSVLVAFPQPLQKIAGRFFPKLRNENTAFRFMLPKLVRQLHESQANCIFCSCSADPSTLGRAFRLAQASGLPLAVYLVDDFLSGAILSGNQEYLRIAQQDVPRWLSKTDRIFVISQGLRDRLQELYNLDSIVLPLPYELPQKPVEALSNQNQEQIIFVGSISHFYIDGVRQLAAVIDELNKETSRCLTLRLTLSNINAVKNLIGDFNCITCKPCLSSEELYQEIASSLLCFAPYSFDEKYKTMVSSSFPSKLLDYLATGRYIVNYAPEYSSSALYFKQHKLSTVLCTEDVSALRDIILRQLTEREDYSLQYRRIIRDYHSYSHVCNRVLHGIATN